MIFIAGFCVISAIIMYACCYISGQCARIEESDDNIK
nr:MAG TPA: hypothetical protein [Caudoviricetes sp.]